MARHNHLAKQLTHDAIPFMKAILPSPTNNNTEIKPSADQLSSWLCRVAQHNDKTAFAGLFEHFAPRIKSYLMKLGASADQAEELAQDTMVTVWDRAETYNPQHASASTWIFTIARNRRIDYLRKTMRPVPDPSDPAFEHSPVPTPRDEIESQEETQRIADALKTLPKEQSDLLYKSFFEDKTHIDIAEETKLPLGTVKSRIRIALEKLRKEIKGEDYGR